MWDPNAVTFISSNILNGSVSNVFVNDDNIVYVLGRDRQQVQLWLEGGTSTATSISGAFNGSQGLFVSTVGDVYIDNGKYNGRVEKWSVNTTSGQMVMNVSGGCFSLFIDVNETLYCSLDTFHQVVKTALSVNLTASATVAGTGTAGSASTMLSGPRGIFVDISTSLYVADCGNNRVQLFRSGQSNGSTLAGNGASSTITLNCPTGIMLDSRGYLYILDLNNHRIVASGPDGFHCVAGCTGINGSAANQLSSPLSFSFDRQGNIFVNDMGNGRIQKFLLTTNSCSTYSNTFALV